MRLSHEPYYTDRRTEHELCCDFPVDESLIDGLHAMQVHFAHNGVNIDIPVVRVMNAAHYLASYMFNTTCSGDQMEYDVLAYASVGHDKQVMLLTMVVLAAMLQRTDGFRARQCRNMLLEDRSEDFYEGVSLYEQFVNSAEERFCEEDFQTDVMREMTELREHATQLQLQNKQLQTEIKQMETMNQYNQFNAPVYQGCTFNNTTNNNYYTQQPEQPVTHQPSKPEPEDVEPVDTSFFCTGQFAPDIIEKNIRDAIESASSKADACRRIMALETCGYIVLSNVPDDRKAELINPFAAPKFIFTQDDFSYARRNKPNRK